MNLEAGSNNRPVRANLQGYVLVATPEQIRELRRLSTTTLNQLFSQAQGHGTALVTLGDQPWTLHRQSDHTFRLIAGTPHRPTL